MPDVSSMTASNFAVAHTVSDFAVGVGFVTMDAQTGLFGARWSHSLTMSPQAAVRLAAALQMHIEAYQRAYGPIPVEPLPFSDAQGAPAEGDGTVTYLHKPVGPGSS